MKKIKWIFIELGYFFLKYALRYRISGSGRKWLQVTPEGEVCKREDFIFKHCKGIKILHIGFADAPFTAERIKDGSMLHLGLKQTAESLFGVDADKEAVDFYSRMTADLEVASLKTDELSVDFIRQFDLILMGEVLEHMKNPHGAMEGLAKKMKCGQQILVTVPNYVSADNIAASLNHKESIHPDHYWYFSPYTLGKIFDSEKWVRKEFAYVFYGKKDPNFIQVKHKHLSDGLAAIFELK
jgi:SAM-dependent methyltransferase